MKDKKQIEKQQWGEREGGTEEEKEREKEGENDVMCVKEIVCESARDREDEEERETESASEIERERVRVRQTNETKGEI